jgi:hypothetical protein
MDVKPAREDSNTKPDPPSTSTNTKLSCLRTWIRSSARHHKLFIVACLLSFAFRSLQTLTWPYGSIIGTEDRAIATFKSSWPPADDWDDNVYPLRPSEPWDISTDFPHPRTLEYDVTEGTWLRLDVHPATGDIIFDMAGDIYCLPADAYNGPNRTSGSEVTGINTAHPIIRGVPHDSDPHFSPDGGSFVFRSDAESGVENIWVTPWSSCRDLSLERDSDPSLTEALAQKHNDDVKMVQGVRETDLQKHRRLLREGRSKGWRVIDFTKLGYAQDI